MSGAQIPKERWLADIMHTPRSLLDILSVLILMAFAGPAKCDLLPPPAQTAAPSGQETQTASSYLGVDSRNVTADRVAALRLKEEQGVEVTMVDQDAPAGKAGLKEHDVILKVNGTAVESVEQLRRMIHEIPPGRVISINVSRNGQALALRAQLASRQNSFPSSLEPKDFHFEMPAMPNMEDFDIPISVVVAHSSSRSGLMIESLTPQLGDFFGAKSGEGVLVRSVEKGSQADKAGFKAGDVIVRIDGREVSDEDDFSRALRSRQDSKVGISILRDKKEQTLTLSLPRSKAIRADNRSELRRARSWLAESDAIC
jgi:serine protease Do